MISVKHFIKNKVVPLLIFDVIVLFFALIEPISFGLNIRAELPFFEKVSAVFLLLSIICIPYFFIWFIIYFFIYLLYNKINKRHLFILIALGVFVLKVFMGFFIFAFLQVSKT